MLKLAHAIYDENGKSCNGKAGDNNGKEVCLWDWYKSGSGWTHLFRAKDTSVAKKLSEVAKSIVENDYIGYDQYQRTTLYTKAKAVNYDISKITDGCECDCSGMVAVCINASGIEISKDMYTGNQVNLIKATNKFEILTDSKYLSSSTYLQEGDILFRKGHTAIIVDVRRKLELQSPYMKGDDVKALQELIGVGNDGVYGNKTDEKVQSILYALGL